MASVLLALLFVKLQLVTVRVPPLFWIAPPLPLFTSPFCNVRPESVTVQPLFIVKNLFDVCALMITVPPSPVMLTFLMIVMPMLLVPVYVPLAIWIVPPG